MALQMKPTSSWFYGRIMINGVKKSVNLGVKIRGKRPSTLREKGDIYFERSRGKAEEKLHKLQAESKRKKASVEILQAIHEARTGDRVKSISLRENGKDDGGMFEAWKRVPRKRTQSERYVEQTKSLFERFIDFLEIEFSDKQVVEMSDVRASMARGFMLTEERRGLSAKTYNNNLIALRSAFGLLAKDAAIFENPFDGIPTKDEDTAFRKPFSIDELSLILEVARRQEHSFIRPIIYTGICTAMRRGDCCLLSRRAVDFEQLFITVKTGKTRKTAQIPLFPLLEEELKRYSVDQNSEYFFPDQAEMYLKNPDGITWRVKKVLRSAGFYDLEKEGNKKPNAKHLSDVHIERENGLRKASIRDFHSFRVSWVTLALTSGVDLELVRMVTGHKTVDIVLKHYFQPGRDYFKRDLQSKMPGLLMSGRIEPKGTNEALSELIELASGLDDAGNPQLKSDLLEKISQLMTGEPNGGKAVAKLLRQP